MYLYIHIPFCSNKCPYCSFASKGGGEALFAPYCNALKKELRNIAARTSAPLQTLFFGGGTPTLLPASLLCDLVDFACTLFATDKDIEISVEANPGTINYHFLKRLRAAGVNRLSIGVQSLDDTFLAALGRIHSAKEAADAVSAAKRAGFTNISLDMIYGIYGFYQNGLRCHSNLGRSPLPRSSQSAKEWQQELQHAIALEPQHLSLYQLSIEEGTPLFQENEKGTVILPDEETILAMDAITEELTAASGYIHYETSNYAQKKSDGSAQCRHNLRYWYNEDFAAAGAAAVSFLDGCRIRREPDPTRYIEKIEKGENPAVEEERLSPEHSFCETVIMGLRMIEGVDIDRLHRRFAGVGTGLRLKQVYGDTLAKLLQKGLLEQSDTRLRLSPLGRPFANQIMAELVVPENCNP